MIKLKSSEYKKYSKFLNNLANKLTRFYFLKLNKPFKVSNKLKGTGYDPVTNADIAFEKFISCLLYTSPSPRDVCSSRMPSSA